MDCAHVPLMYIPDAPKQITPKDIDVVRPNQLPQSTTPVHPIIHITNNEVDSSTSPCFSDLEPHSSIIPLLKHTSGFEQQPPFSRKRQATSSSTPSSKVSQLSATSNSPKGKKTSTSPNRVTAIVLVDLVIPTNNQFNGNATYTGPKLSRMPDTAQFSFPIILIYPESPLFHVDKLDLDLDT